MSLTNAPWNSAERVLVFCSLGGIFYSGVKESPAMLHMVANCLQRFKLKEKLDTLAAVQYSVVRHVSCQQHLGRAD